MGDLSEFSLAERVFLRAYPWRRIDPVPWTPLRAPLAQARLALVSSAGLVLPGQPPFDDSIVGGDPSVREIPSDARVESLIDTHRSKSYDHAGVRADPNLAFPLDRVRELAALDRIGEVNRRHVSFMGSITVAGRVLRRTAPETAGLLAADRVDVALLVPV